MLFSARGFSSSKTDLKAKRGGIVGIVGAFFFLDFLLAISVTD